LFKNVERFSGLKILVKQKVETQMTSALAQVKIVLGHF